MNLPALEKSDDVPLPTTPEMLFSHLENLEIAYDLYHHEAVFTCEDAALIEDDIPGGHCKTLFVKDKKGNKAIIVALDETRINLKNAAAAMGLKRLSFGSPERLWDTLGVRPGSVTPFALINDPDVTIKVFLDASMMEHETLNYHPLLNTMTVNIVRDDLVKYIRACGHEPEIIDFAALME